MSDTLPSAAALSGRDVARLLSERIADLTPAAAEEIVNALFDVKTGIITQQLLRPDPAEAAVNFRSFGLFERKHRLGEGDNVLQTVRFTPATSLRRRLALLED